MPASSAAGLGEASSKGVEKLARQLAAEHSIDAALAEHLAWIYGTPRERARPLPPHRRRQPPLPRRVILPA